MKWTDIDYHPALVAHRTQRRARRLGWLIAIGIMLALVILVVLLTGCTPNLCDPGVSFIQTSATTFDAYRDGARIAVNVTLEQIQTECGR